MNRIVYFIPIIALLVFTGCNKRISHNSGMFWGNKTNGSRDYNADVFSGSNNAIQYNAPSVQANKNQQEPVLNYQADPQQYDISQNDKQLTRAINSGYNAQPSQLAKQEGQIDLMQGGYANKGINNNINNIDNKQNDNSQQHDCCGRCQKCMNNSNNNNYAPMEVKSEPKYETKYEVKNDTKSIMAEKSYKIQAGYYLSEKSANDVVAELRNAGISDIVVITENGGSKIYVGSFQDRSSCNSVLEQVRKIKSDAFVVFK